MILDLVSRESCHENTCIGSQAFCATLGATALQIANLLDAGVECAFPGFLRDFYVLAVENSLNGVGAIQRAVSALFAQNE
jgi:hypothetical protein